MNQELVDVLASISVAGQVGRGEVFRLRDALWGEEVLTQPAVESLFDLNDRCREAAPEWTAFLVEVVDHFLLHQSQPYGFLDEKGAAWIRTRFGRTGKIKSWTEMEVIVSLLESAENVPDWLKAWVLAQVEETIVSGCGPSRGRVEPVPNQVDDAEVVLLRRLIFAGGGEGAVVVGTSEADMLFRIKDRTLGSVNAEGWLPLFVQGVGNHLMAHSDYRPLERDEAARLHDFMENHTPHLWGFLGRTLPSHMLGVGTVAEAFKAVFDDSDHHFGDDAAIAEDLAITAEEAGWLKQHIAADDKTDDYEKALLTFIIEEAGSVPSMIEGLRRRA
jgi:hypothetical protein